VQLRVSAHVARFAYVIVGVVQSGEWYNRGSGTIGGEDSEGSYSFKKKNGVARVNR
jgi:hypothetical protein